MMRYGSHTVGDKFPAYLVNLLILSYATKTKDRTAGVTPEWFADKTRTCTVTTFI